MCRPTAHLSFAEQSRQVLKMWTGMTVRIGDSRYASGTPMTDDPVAGVDTRDTPRFCREPFTALKSTTRWFITWLDVTQPQAGWVGKVIEFTHEGRTVMGKVTLFMEAPADY